MVDNRQVHDTNERPLHWLEEWHAILIELEHAAQLGAPIEQVRAVLVWWPRDFVSSVKA